MVQIIWTIPYEPYDKDHIIKSMSHGHWQTFWLEWSCFLCLTSWYSSLKTLPQSHLNELLLWVFSWIFKYSGEVVSYPHNWLKIGWRVSRSRKVTTNSSSMKPYQRKMGSWCCCWWCWWWWWPWQLWPSAGCIIGLGMFCSGNFPLIFANASSIKSS